MSAQKNKKQINLLPREDFDKTTLGRVLKWSLTTFRYIVIFVELIVVGGFLSRFYFDVQIGNLNEEIMQQSAAISARSDFERIFRKTQLKLSVLENISSESNSVIPIIKVISDNISSDSQVTRLTKDGAKVSIEIATLSEVSALNFTENLRRSDVFLKLSITRVQSDETTPYTSYTLEGILNYKN